MSIVKNTDPWSAGLRSQSMARNGKYTSGANAALVADMVNMLSGRRMHMLAAAGSHASALFPGTGTMRAYIHTSPNIAGVEAIVIVTRKSTGASHGAFQWTVDSYANPVRYVAGGSGAAATPSSLAFERVRLVIDSSNTNLAGDTAYSISCNLNAGSTGALECHGMMVYEVTRKQMDSNTHTCVPSDVFKAGSPILDRDIEDLTASLWTIYRRQGPTQFNWTDTENSPPTQTGSTWKNILSGSTAGWASTDRGFWTIPYRKGRLISSGTVAVRCWARAAVNTGSGGRVRFINSAGTIATITGFGTSASVITADATLDATISTSDLVVVEHSDSTGNTVTTYAAGMYEYLT